MLKSAARDGTGRCVLQYWPACSAAVKTGSSDEHRDAWVAGYTSQLATVVWVGRDDNTPLIGTASRVAAPLWGRFMAEAHRAGASWR